MEELFSFQNKILKIGKLITEDIRVKRIVIIFSQYLNNLIVFMKCNW